MFYVLVLKIFAQYRKEIDISYMHHDISRTDGVDEKGCQRICDITASCVAFVIDITVPTRPCWMKRDLGQKVAKVGARTFIKSGSAVVPVNEQPATVSIKTANPAHILPVPVQVQQAPVQVQKVPLEVPSDLNSSSAKSQSQPSSPETPGTSLASTTVNESTPTTALAIPTESTSSPSETRTFVADEAVPTAFHNNITQLNYSVIRNYKNNSTDKKTLHEAKSNEKSKLGTGNAIYISLSILALLITIVCILTYIYRRKIVENNVFIEKFQRKNPMKYSCVTASKDSSICNDLRTESYYESTLLDARPIRQKIPTIYKSYAPTYNTEESLNSDQAFAESHAVCFSFSDRPPSSMI